MTYLSLASADCAAAATCSDAYLAFSRMMSFDPCELWPPGDPRRGGPDCFLCNWKEKNIIQLQFVWIFLNYKTENTLSRDYLHRKFTTDLLVLKRPHLGSIWSISCLLMPLLLVLPGHQQPCYMLVTMQDKMVLVFKETGFHIPVPSQCWEIIKNVNISFMFPKIYSAQPVLNLPSNL